MSVSDNKFLINLQLLSENLNQKAIDKGKKRILIDALSFLAVAVARLKAGRGN